MHGRAGRENLPGEVIIQTYNPENFAIECAKKQNFEEFYETEIKLRKQLNYPPFCDIIVFGFSGENQNEIIKISKYMFEILKSNLEKRGINIFMPMPAPIDKIQNKYRWRIIAKGNVTDDVSIIINKCLKNIYDKNLKNVNIVVDVNPNNML